MQSFTAEEQNLLAQAVLLLERLAAEEARCSSVEV
jgi:hypothetical protein